MVSMAFAIVISIVLAISMVHLRNHLASSSKAIKTSEPGTPSSPLIIIIIIIIIIIQLHNQSTLKLSLSLHVPSSFKSKKTILQHAPQEHEHPRKSRCRHDQDSPSSFISDRPSHTSGNRLPPGPRADLSPGRCCAHRFDCGFWR
ncbi:hypothetical protein BC939DRAFT_299490 [Gamsiella multidivaricata]|uniref:uncharacterized protein n=1 Tax=Gamsiella multidivaricata TaxID=101098 RepID=UPI00221F6760|nr:uncharacterized protein BC939DRAFT_299490 [Gamsiella multidivaricata]KAI7818141.1 hypothetical protein BC939DRAFT_299490 [Gamsiella multidivaricata]